MNKELYQRLLDYYKIDEQQYQELTRPLSIDSFALGHNFKHINEAVDLVNKIIKENGKIFIYGDYDADGVMGTSILVKMFDNINYHVDYYVPSRYIDGYGLTLNKAQECIDNGVNLLICVDNGVSAFESIKLLKDNGVKVLVLDHHEVQEEIPNADYILHPTFDGFGDIPSSAGFVAFNFSRAFLGYYDKYLSTLASISLVSDMMPLLWYNRDLLRLTIENYKEHEFLQIDLLKEDESFDEVTIGMKIAPKINSIGRVLTDTSINELVKFFTSKDKNEILNYIDWINETNENRKSLSKDIDDESIDINDNIKAIVYVANSSEGIIGLIANNLLGKYHLPVVVLTETNEKGVFKGSARAPLGFSLLAAFKYCEDLLVVSGGHLLAGGCTIKKENIESFKERFNEYAIKNPVVAPVEEYIELPLVDLNLDNYHLVQTFSPFGEGWPKPQFVLRHIATKSLFFSKNREHIITQLSPRSKIVGFNFPIEEVRKYQFIDMFGTLRTSIYNNVTSVEFYIKKLEKIKH